MTEKLFTSNLYRGVGEIFIHIDDKSGIVYLYLRESGMEIKKFKLNPKYLQFADFYQEKLQELGLLWLL